MARKAKTEEKEKKKAKGTKKEKGKEKETKKEKAKKEKESGKVSETKRRTLEGVGNQQEVSAEKPKAKLEKLELNGLKKNSGEIENLVVKLAQEGLATAKIGLVLRDSYGIPSVKVIDKKIGKILATKGLSSKIPEDISILLKKAEKLKKHFEKNKQDKVAKRSLQLIEAKIKKLSDYFKKRGVLSKDWKYT